MLSITFMNELYQEGVEDRRERFKESAIKALVIVGLIVVLAMGAYGSVQVFRSAPNLFSLLGAAVVNITSLFVPADRDTTSIITSDEGSGTLENNTTAQPVSPSAETITPGNTPG